jgi:hypothetical protein
MNLCNHPTKMPNLEKLILCDDGFHEQIYLDNKKFNSTDIN